LKTGLRTEGSPWRRGEGTGGGGYAWMNSATRSPPPCCRRPRPPLWRERRAAPPASRSRKRKRSGDEGQAVRGRPRTDPEAAQVEERGPLAQQARAVLPCTMAVWPRPMSTRPSDSSSSPYIRLPTQPAATKDLNPNSKSLPLWRECFMLENYALSVLI
jgi:hypothetical protein